MNFKPRDLIAVAILAGGVILVALNHSETGAAMVGAVLGWFTRGALPSK